MKTVIGILSGGAGSTLWPLSRPNYPKQFHNLSGSGQPLIVDTISRFEESDSKVIVTTEDLVPITGTMLHRMNIKNVEVLAEPEGRGTLPALMLFLKKVLKEGDAVCGLVASDIVVKNEDTLKAAMNEAIEHAAADKIVSIIATTTQANSKAIGYVAASQVKGSLYKVHAFAEKPDKEYLDSLKSGEHELLANMGHVFFRASKMNAILEDLFSDSWTSFRDSETDEGFSSLPKMSLEKGVFENFNDLHSIKADIEWHDVGCWDDDLSPILGSEKVEISGSGNEYVHLHAKSKPVVFVGMNETVVVDTPDALLVMKKGSGNDVNLAASRLQGDLGISLPDHAFEERPWGRFEILLDMDHFKSKRLIIHPGKKLSYQRHQKRSEQWTVIKGEAEVTLDDEVKIFKVGEHVEIPAGTKHRLANPSTEKILEVVEVQTGSYFGEDDIERFQDDFGRN